MRKLVYLASPRDDLTGIFEYITRESGSVSNAKGFVNALRNQCGKLATLPGWLGRPRPELRPDIRSFPFRGDVIFFRYQDEFFEVVNILEGHRDVEDHFGHDPT